MKKCIAIICIAVAFCLCFTGCQIAPTAPAVAPTYHALISDYSDSVDGVITGVEYMRQIVDKDPPSDTWTVTYNGIAYTGSYFISDDISDTHMYNCGKDYSFHIDSAGNLVGFSDRTIRYSETMGEPISRQDCIQLAEDFFSQYADPSEYSIQASELLEDRYYIVSFIKILPGDIYTTEFCNVELLADGRIYYFTAQNLGLFPHDMDTSDLSKDAAYAAMETRLDELFADKKEAFDNVEYKYYYLQLAILEDGRRAFMCYARVNCSNESDNNYDEYVLQFVIPVS